MVDENVDIYKPLEMDSGTVQWTTLRRMSEVLADEQLKLS